MSSLILLGVLERRSEDEMTLDVIDACIVIKFVTSLIFLISG